MHIKEAVWRCTSTAIRDLNDAIGHQLLHERGFGNLDILPLLVRHIPTMVHPCIRVQRASQFALPVQSYLVDPFRFL